MGGWAEKLPALTRQLQALYASERFGRDSRLQPTSALIRVQAHQLTGKKGEAIQGSEKQLFSQIGDLTKISYFPL